MLKEKSLYFHDYEENLDKNFPQYIELSEKENSYVKENIFKALNIPINITPANLGKIMRPRYELLIEKFDTDIEDILRAPEKQRPVFR